MILKPKLKIKEEGEVTEKIGPLTSMKDRIKAQIEG